jgi:hypothetical protein
MAGTAVVEPDHVAVTVPEPVVQDCDPPEIQTHSAAPAGPVT